MSDILTIFSTIIKNLFKKSACDMYPVKKPELYDNTKGCIGINAPECILCSLCEKKCPTHALAVDKEARTWAIERGKCILCNRCVEACPKKCLLMEQQYAGPVKEQKAEVINIPVSTTEKAEGT
jgi:formate hydrogenlyase subunit 6/NADH:ubiquinone oxidoreductase subunit I